MSKPAKNEIFVNECIKLLTGLSHQDWQWFEPEWAFEHGKANTRYRIAFRVISAGDEGYFPSQAATMKSGSKLEVDLISRRELVAREHLILGLIDGDPSLDDLMARIENSEYSGKITRLLGTLLRKRAAISRIPIRERFSERLPNRMKILWNRIIVDGPHNAETSFQKFVAKMQARGLWPR
jgi:hypothetical protein